MVLQHRVVETFLLIDWTIKCQKLSFDHSLCYRSVDIFPGVQRLTTQFRWFGSSWLFFCKPPLWNKSILSYSATNKNSNVKIRILSNTIFGNNGYRNSVTWRLRKYIYDEVSKMKLWMIVFLSPIKS